MQTSLLTICAALSLLVLGGCNRAQSPADVQHDVTTAANSAAEKNSQASEKQSDVASAVNKDLDIAGQKADVKTANAAADAAVTAAEGAHKVSLARCEALAGDAQKACRSEADAALDMARAKASALRASTG